jgi:hypothetical protein
MGGVQEFFSLISPEEKPVIVRLNTEIKAQLVCKFKPGIHKQVVGEPVYWKEIDDILDIRLLKRTTQMWLTLHQTFIIFS